MDNAAKGVTPESIGEEVAVATEQIVAETKEGVTKAPSRIRQLLGQVAAMWERASVRPSVSGSEGVVVGSSLSGLYGEKFDALANEHEQVRPDKG